MTLESLCSEASFAVATVERAGRLAQRIRAGMVSDGMNVTKRDLSPVTVADFAVQALVAHALAGPYPGEPLVAEESSRDLRSSEAVLETVTQYLAEEIEGADAESVCRWIDRGAAQPGGRYWVLDPIDGTKGFLRGGQYAVALALMDGPRVELGVLGCPNLGPEYGAGAPGGPGVIVVAARGRGAWQAGAGGALVPLRASPCRGAGVARLLRSHEAGHTDAAKTELFAQALGLEAPPVRMDSQAKYVLLAAGHAELMLRLLSPRQPDYREKIWDQAAGSIVLEEAGGRITDLDGRALDFSRGRRLEANRGLLASNGPLHDRALDALRQVGA